MLDTILHRGAEPVRWLIVAGIAYTLATTIWTFFQTPIGTSVSLPDQATTDSDPRPPANVNWILSRNLFGEAGAAPESAATESENAVQTRLPLELQSVMVASDPAQSTAIVAQRGKPGQVYHVGEKLPGNAELVDVHNDRIILRRAGTRESLMFPKLTSGFEALPQESEVPQDIIDAETQSVGAAPADSTAAADTVEQSLERYRQRLAEDAAGTLDELGLQAADTGGYRVGDLSQAPYLQRTGLQPGDVILSVNGRPVGDIQTDQLELDNIMAAGSARIEVQRGSRRFFITASLK